MAEKALAKRRHNATPAELRMELINDKRQVELERILLPGAPPRKRKTRNPSPEREICPLIEQQPKHEHQPEPEHSILNMDVIIVGQEVEVEILPEPTQPKLQTSFNDLDDCEAYDWALADDSDGDLDIDFDDACPLPGTQYALTESTCLTGLTELQTEVLQTEDDINNCALRDILTSEDNYNFDWKKDRSNFTGQRETFTGTSGPTFDVTGISTADIFYKMFDTDFIDRLCTETNHYAAQKIARLKVAKKLLPSSRLHKWTPTDRDEMISFLVLLILQGLYPLPEEEKYFSFNGFGTMPYFPRVMSYNRFLLIKMMYHFVDNQTTAKTKLCKIQPVLDYFNDKFSTLYIPSQEIAIDESLLKWHGRLSFSQKIATKAAQVGVKTYELCESHSGYLWKFIVYTGKKTAQTTNPKQKTDDMTLDQPNDPTVQRADYETLDRPQDDETVIRPGGSLARPTNATAKIVLDLMEPLLHCGYTLVMDNFYNSPLLLRYLKKQKTDCYGTLRLNREYVPDSLKTITKSDLRQGEVVASYTSDLSVMVWRDANLVSMISTYHRLQVGVQNKNERITYKPKIVLDYNKSMGGVDRKDQFLSAQPVERLRNKIWYKKVFCRLFNSALFNAFIIFSSHYTKVTHRQFRTILAEDLLKRHRDIDLTTEPRLYTGHDRQLTKRTNSHAVVDHDHFPARSIKKRCKMCTRQKKDSRSIWICRQCGVNLCIENCFRDYHKTKLH